MQCITHIGTNRGYLGSLTSSRISIVLPQKTNDFTTLI